jgi:hypothetical protein
MKNCPHCQEAILEQYDVRFCRNGCDIATVFVPGVDPDDADDSIELLPDGGMRRVPTCHDDQ